MTTRRPEQTPGAPLRRDPERLDQKALEVVKSVEQKLADRAVAACEDLVGGW
jgi:hypothetical protein